MRESISNSHYWQKVTLHHSVKHRLGTLGLHETNIKPQNTGEQQNHVDTPEAQTRGS